MLYLLRFYDDILVFTSPPVQDTKGDGSTVWLGEDDFASKFKNLRTFWENEVLPHQNKRFELIDLRFDSQVVVKEHLR